VTGNRKGSFWSSQELRALIGINRALLRKFGTLATKMGSHAPSNCGGYYLYYIGLFLGCTGVEVSFRNKQGKKTVWHCVINRIINSLILPSLSLVLSRALCGMYRN